MSEGQNGHSVKKHPLEYVIVGLLFLTLLATGIAACYTKKQWETADDTEKRGLRAYVSLRDIRLSESNINTFDIIPEWENTGATPTVDMKATINNLITNVQIPKYIAFDDLNGINTVPIALGPKATLGVAFMQASRECLDQFNRRDDVTQFQIWGRASYQDVFTASATNVGTRHTTNFCWNVNQVLFSTDGKSAHLSYSLCEQGNCADDECQFPPPGTLFETTVPPCKSGSPPPAPTLTPTTVLPKKK